MSTPLWILLIVIGFLAGAVAGFFGARSYMKKYFEENPPVDEDMISAMMSQMGQKPSAKKLNQVMNQMKASQKSANKKK